MNLDEKVKNLAKISLEREQDFQKLLIIVRKLSERVVKLEEGDNKK